MWFLLLEAYVDEGRAKAPKSTPFLVFVPSGCHLFATSSANSLPNMSLEYHTRGRNAALSKDRLREILPVKACENTNLGFFRENQPTNPLDFLDIQIIRRKKWSFKVLCSGT
jgi:hypothetical protein